MVSPIQTTTVNKKEGEAAGRFSIIKIAVLGVLGVAASIATVGYLESFLQTTQTVDLVLGIIFGVLFLTIVALETLFVRGMWMGGLIALLQGIAPLTLFTGKIFQDVASASVLLAGALVFFAFHYVGIRRGQVALENGVKIKFFGITKPAVPKVVTGLLIFLVLVFYLTYIEWGSFNDTLGKKVSDQFIETAEPIAQIWFPGVSADQTVGAFIETATEVQIRKMKTESAEKGVLELDFDLLAPEQRKFATERIAEEVRKNLEGIVGPISNEELLKDATYRIIKEQFQRLQNASKVGALLGAGAAILLFGFLKSLAFLFSWLIELFAFVIFQILIVTGFANVSFKSTTQETISI